MARVRLSGVVRFAVPMGRWENDRPIDEDQVRGEVREHDAASASFSFAIREAERLTALVPPGFTPSAPVFYVSRHDITVEVSAREGSDA